MRTAQYDDELEALEAVRVLGHFDCEPELVVHHDAIECGPDEPPMHLYEVRCHELPTKLTNAPRLSLVAQPEPDEHDAARSSWWDRDFDE